MKTRTLTTILMIAAAPLAYADGHQALQVNFNQEIDQNNSNAQDLSKDVSASMADPQAEPVIEAAAKPSTDEKDQVTNFVDFEIQSVGQQQDASAKPKQAVDRRYNSVGEPELTLTKSSDN